jgi:hypothetical protein
VLHDKNADQQHGQERPEDDKDPDVNFLVCDTEDPGPINQYVYAPIEDLIYHVLPPFWKFSISFYM